MVSWRGRGLWAYTYEEWGKLEARLLSVEDRSPEMQRVVRTFIGSAFDCRCDKQDRILVPAALREQADLDKEIAIVGVLTRFEVWSRQNWEEEIRQQEEDAKREEVRREISRLGL